MAAVPALHRAQRERPELRALRVLARAAPASARLPPGTDRPLGPGQAGHARELSKYLGAVLQGLLQQEFVHDGHGAARRGRDGMDRRRAGGAATEAACLGFGVQTSSSATVQPTSGPAHLALPAPARRNRSNRKCGESLARTPEVWRNRFRRAAASQKAVAPQHQTCSLTR